MPTSELVFESPLVFITTIRCLITWNVNNDKEIHPGSKGNSVKKFRSYKIR